MQVPAALAARANHRTLLAIGSQSGGRETSPTHPHPQPPTPRLLGLWAGLSVLSWTPVFQKEALSLLSKSYPGATALHLSSTRIWALCIVTFITGR